MNKPNWIAGFIILLLPALFVMKYTAVPYPFYSDDVAVLKVAFQHTGKRVIPYDEIKALKERAKQYREELKNERQVRMSLKSRQGATRERFPLEMELIVDGKKLLDKEYQAMGRQRDMAAVVYDAFELKPGTHHIRAVMKDSKREDAISYVFEDTVEFNPRDVKVITFDQVKGKLFWSENLTPLLSREKKKREEG